MTYNEGSEAKILRGQRAARRLAERGADAVIGGAAVSDETRRRLVLAIDNVLYHETQGRYFDAMCATLDDNQSMKEENR